MPDRPRLPGPGPPQWGCRKPGHRCLWLSVGSLTGPPTPPTSQALAHGAEEGVAPSVCAHREHAPGVHPGLQAEWRAGTDRHNGRPAEPRAPPPTHPTSVKSVPRGGAPRVQRCCRGPGKEGNQGVTPCKSHPEFKATETGCGRLKLRSLGRGLGHRTGSRKQCDKGFPWWLSGKEPACNAGDGDSIPRSGR